MIKVLVVDDHVALCDLFKNAFENEDGFKVVAELNNALLAPLYCKQYKPNLVLMDICAEGKAPGLEAAIQIKKMFPEIKIILMSGFDEVSFVEKAKEAKVDAFIYKSKSLDFFMKTARAVIDGETYFPEPKQIEMPDGELPFTAKEMIVLRYLCACKSRKEISEEMHISENTVKFHISNILAKSGFTNTAELSIHMISSGWINPHV